MKNKTAPSRNIKAPFLGYLYMLPEESANLSSHFFNLSRCFFNFPQYFSKNMREKYA